MREPLHNRVNGEWTEFESKLFNLVTQCKEVTTPHLLFSGRLALVQDMLNAYDNFFKSLQRPN